MQNKNLVQIVTQVNLSIFNPILYLYCKKCSVCFLFPYSDFSKICAVAFQNLSTVDYQGISSMYTRLFSTNFYISVSRSVHLCTVVCIEIILMCTEIVMNSENVLKTGMS